MYKKTLTALIIIFILSVAGSGFAGTKFINKDTAKNRKPVKFGTSVNKNTITIESDKESNIISTKPKKKEEATSPVEGPIFVTPEIKIEKD